MTDITYKKIVSKAKTGKKNIINKHKLGISQKWGYYIGKSIISPKKNIKKISIQKPTNPIGQAINQKLTKSEYIKIIERFIAFVEKNKQLPNYITVKDKKVHPKVFCAYVGNILVYYYKKGVLPKSYTIKSNVFNKPKKYNYLTNYGCSGMGQCTGYYCACNSLQQSFYKLTGILVSESTIAEWAGTTSSGTDHSGINTAVAQFNKKYNKNVKIAWYNFSDLGWDKINEFLKTGAVFFHLLYRLKWGHYEPIKSVGDPLKILNSLGDSCGSGTYCGYIENRSKSEQRQYISGISQKSVAVLTI